MTLFISASVFDQTAPLDETKYPPCPIPPKLKPKFLLSTIFLWQTPTATQLEVH